MNQTPPVRVAMLGAQATLQQKTSRHDDHSTWVRFGLGLVGAAVLLGALVGACYGAARDVVASCCAFDDV